MGDHSPKGTIFRINRKKKTENINGTDFHQPVWKDDNPKLEKYKMLYEVITVFDKSQRIQKLLSTNVLDEENQIEVPLLKLDNGISLAGVMKELRNAQKVLISLPSEVGSYIWEQATLSSNLKESVQWDNFYQQFQTKFSVIMSNDYRDQAYQCFRLILNTRNTSTITKLLWEYFSTWFSFALTSDDKVNELLQWIKDIFNTRWYHGFKDKTSTDERLKEKVEDLQLNRDTRDVLFYLIRSTQTPGIFALNYCQNVHDNSTPIPVQEEIEISDMDKNLDKVIPSIEKSIRAFQEKRKKTKCIALPSPADPIFEEKQSGGYQTSI